MGKNGCRLLNVDTTEIFQAGDEGDLGSSHSCSDGDM